MEKKYRLHYFLVMAHKINKQVGEKIARVRKGQGVTQEQLALKIGVEPATVSNIERGETNTSVYVVFKIALALKIHIRELFTFR